jgi:hypothetical protein
MRKILSVPALLLLAACQREAPPVDANAPAATAPAATTPATPAAPVPGRPQVQTLTAAGPLSDDTGTTGLCNLEGMGDANFGPGPMAISGSAPVLVHGWAGLSSNMTAPSSVNVRFESAADPTKAWEITVPMDGTRNDVAKATNSPAMANSGFGGPIDLSTLPAGDYKVFLVYGGDNHNYFCANARQVQLSNP